MFLFIWSLVIDAISYVRRRRLWSQTEMQVARGCGVVLRSVRHDLEAGMRHRIAGPSLYRTESVELTSCSKPVLNEADWRKFEEVEIVSARSSSSSISQSGDQEVLNFVAAVVVSEKKLHEFRTVSIDKEAHPLAWRMDENLEILFSGTKRSLRKLIDTCGTGILQYRDTFEVAQLTTVDLSEEFKRHLGLGCSEFEERNSRSPPPSQSCKPPVFFKTLEDLCISDIIASRHLCDSVMSQESVSETWTESDFSSSCVITPPESLNPFNLSVIGRNYNGGGSCGSSMDEVGSIEVDFHAKSTSESAPPLSYPALEKEIREAIWDSDGSANTDVNYNRGMPNKLSCDFKQKPRLLELSNGFIEGKSSSMRRPSLTTQQMDHISVSRLSRTGSPQVRSLTTSQERVDLRSRSSSPHNSVKSISTIVSKSNMKPPNILIYTGPEDSSEQQFQKLKLAITSCLDKDRYVVYRIKPESFCVAPWRDNTVCLIVADTDGLDEKGWERLFAYFKGGGKMLFICQNKLLSYLKSCKSAKKRLGILKHAFVNEASSKEFEKFLKLLSKKLKYPSVREQMEVRKHDGSLEYFLSVIREVNSPLLLYMQNSEKRAGALFSDIEVETFLNGGGVVLVREALRRLELNMADVSKPIGLSPGYLICSDHEHYRKLSAFIEANPSVAGLNLTIEFFQGAKSTAAPADKYLPVYVLREEGTDLDFKFDLYFSYLCTRTLGQLLLYVPVITSTMKIFERMSSMSGAPENVIAVAKHQTQGLGRGGNNWLSPAGCAMFSYPLKVNLTSKLGKKLGYVQHLAALSVVDGICSLPGYEGLDLRLKWPNDIYWGAKVKLGGVIVNSSVFHNIVHCTIGTGINVSNEKPTVCINQLLRDGVAPLSCEIVIARALSRLEELLEIFERKGLEGVLPLYYKYWLHESQDILIVANGEHVVIRGLDDNGFLQVRSKHTGEVYSVQPDGNTFDMLHNTIRVK